MNNAIDVKRGTTPTLPIRINIPFENIKHIDFIFKRQKSENYPKLLEIGFDFPETIVEVDGDSFIINAELSKEETRKLIQGKVFMDTQIIFNNGKIPPTEIVELNIGETLFKGVFKE